MVRELGLKENVYRKDRMFRMGRGVGKRPWCTYSLFCQLREMDERTDRQCNQ